MPKHVHETQLCTNDISKDVSPSSTTLSHPLVPLARSVKMVDEWQSCDFPGKGTMLN